MTKLETALSALSGGSDSAIRRAFDLMKIAEDAILAAKSKVRNAEVRERLHRSFMLVAPPPSMYKMADWLYRSHAEELLERVRNGLDTKLATKAEVMLALMSMSLKHPLTRDYAALYERLFCATAPTNLTLEFDASPKGSYEGAVEELYQDLKRKVANPRTQ